MEAVRARWIQKQGTLSLEKRQVERLHQFVRAYSRVEHKTFLDNIHKKIRKFILIGREEWIKENMNPHNPKLLEIPLEQSFVEKKRKFLKDSISTLERCMKEIEEFGGLEHMEHKGKTYREQTEIFGI